MESGCLFKVMVVGLGLLVLPTLLFGQNQKQEQSLFEAVAELFTPNEEEIEVDNLKIFKKFAKQFPEGKTPYEISVKMLENAPENSENKEIDYRYSKVYRSMESAMYSRSGGQTSYHFDRKIIENENFTAFTIEQRQWRQAGAEYSIVVFDKKGNFTDERTIAGNYYDQIKTCRINESGEITVTIFDKVRTEDQEYDWTTYSELKETKTVFLKITEDGKLNYFTPETVTGSLKN